jgi:hypothetical protein
VPGSPDQLWSKEAIGEALVWGQKRKSPKLRSGWRAMVRTNWEHESPGLRISVWNATRHLLWTTVTAILDPL